MSPLPSRSPTSFSSFLLDDLGSRPRRYTLCITSRCNLACTYCYVVKSPTTMSLEMAQRSLDFIFKHAPPKSNLEIGFFGGEPLLEFPLIQSITAMLESHPAYDPARVGLTITTNGTIFSDKIADFLNAHAFKVCISCDGPAHVQDLYRRTSGGQSTAAAVERTLLAAQQAFPTLLVNAVYNPSTLPFVPETLDYLASLGLHYIFFNPDYTAHWSRQDAEDLPAVYRAVAERYVAWYLDGDPHFVSLIDTKIAVVLRGGYHPLERCQMGTGELAITPDGGLYPCERLIGSGTGEEHRIGTIQAGVNLAKLLSRCAPGGEVNLECEDCSLKGSCMNWCGCSNAFMTGFTNRVGPFLCVSERTAIQTALDVYTTLERQLGPLFLHHLSGELLWNSRMERKGNAL